MTWVATDRAGVLKDACPMPSTAVGPANVVVGAAHVPPSMKVTDPVGVPEAGATTLTVAVNVTDCPNTEGFADAGTTVVVLAGWTIWLTTRLVLSKYLVTP